MSPEKRLLAVTQLACELAARLRDATATDDDADYDRSRTWCDRQDDRAFAISASRKLAPTLHSLNKKSKQ